MFEKIEFDDRHDDKYTPPVDLNQQGSKDKGQFTVISF